MIFFLSSITNQHDHQFITQPNKTRSTMVSVVLQLQRGIWGLRWRESRTHERICMVAGRPPTAGSVQWRRPPRVRRELLPTRPLYHSVHHPRRCAPPPQSPTRLMTKRRLLQGGMHGELPRARVYVVHGFELWGGAGARGGPGGGHGRRRRPASSARRAGPWLPDAGGSRIMCFCG